MKNLSVVLGGDRVSVLMNANSEPETEEMVTLVSLLDKRPILLHQVTSTVFAVISELVAGLMLMVQVKDRGVAPPANSEPRATMMSTFGVDTRGINCVLLVRLVPMQASLHIKDLRTGVNIGMYVWNYI